MNTTSYAKICSVEVCPRPSHTKGLCQSHYARSRINGGDPGVEAIGSRPRRAKKTCTIEGCDRPYLASGLCNMHYRRKGRGDIGRPESMVPGRLPKGSQGACSVSGCEKQAVAKHMCKLHYYRTKASGDPLKTVSGRIGKGEAAKTCTIVGCDKPVNARNMCAMHYQRTLSQGSPGEAAGRRAPNGAGFVDTNGYRKVRGRFEHRTAMEEQLGRPLLPNETVHHINGQRADNRPENLELMSSSHPAGQRVSDKVAWAKELLALYEP